ncbi:MAG: plasmid maintenance system killer [Pleurocapsa sp. SU_196_0]|nr:plasmid maintenance system killer [Pleurocapsa sp. SU_196_0]
MILLTAEQVLDILFKTKRLERCYLALDEGSRVYGPIVARKYVQRINIIKAASSLDDLRRLPPLRLHPLKGPLKGSWAIDLHDRYRLISLSRETTSRLLSSRR